MIDISNRRGETEVANSDNPGLQQYVHALLARQQALDLLESIHQQINDVWAVMRRLLDYTGAAAKATQAIRVARAAQAAQAQNTYRFLEKRREECIAALHQAERRANAALQTLLAAAPKSSPSGKKSSISLSSRARFGEQEPCRTGRRKAKRRTLKSLLNPGVGMTDAFIGN